MLPVKYILLLKRKRMSIYVYSKMITTFIYLLERFFFVSSIILQNDYRIYLCISREILDKNSATFNEFDLYVGQYFHKMFMFFLFNLVRFLCFVDLFKYVNLGHLFFNSTYIRVDLYASIYKKYSLIIL